MTERLEEIRRLAAASLADSLMCREVLQDLDASHELLRSLVNANAAGLLHSESGIWEDAEAALTAAPLVDAPGDERLAHDLEIAESVAEMLATDRDDALGEAQHARDENERLCDALKAAQGALAICLPPNATSDRLLARIDAALAGTALDDGRREQR
jgi:hypothetical protein